MASNETEKPGPRSKVHRLLTDYDLEGLGDELERRWTADSNDNRASLRDLATMFNTRLLTTVLREAGAIPMDGEAENLYRLLNDDEVSTADRTRAKRRLEGQDIDVEALQSEFVSYQAIRTYLTSHRDAEYTRGDFDRMETVAEQVQRLRSRTANVTETKLTRLRSTEELTVGEFQVTVAVKIICEECGKQFDLDTLLKRGACGCNQ